MYRNLIIIAIALFTWGLGESAFFVFQPLYLQQLGADPVQIGTILGGAALAAMLSHAPAGYLSDRFGRRPVMLAAWVQGALATWIMALSGSLAGFAAGLLLYGMTAYVAAPMWSYITAARGRLPVGQALTLMSASYNVGAIAGPVLGGLFGERYGYRVLFLYAAGIFIVSTLTVFLIRPQPVEVQETRPPARLLLSNSRYLTFLAVYFLAVFAMYLPQPLSPNFLQNQRGLSLFQIGQLSSVGSLGLVLINLAGGLISARLGYLLGHLLVGAFALLLWQGQGMWAFALAYFLLGGFRTARSLATAHIRSLVQQGNMGVAYGIAETVASLALVAAPAAAGFLYDRSPGWMYPAAIGLIGLSVLVNTLVTANRRAAPAASEAAWQDGL